MEEEEEGHDRKALRRRAVEREKKFVFLLSTRKHTLFTKETISSSQSLDCLPATLSTGRSKCSSSR